MGMPVIIGAGVGALSSAAMGKSPLTGALLGGVTGGAFGGGYGGSLSCTEEYNGTSWSAGGALITARQQLAGAGLQNAGLAFGGAVYPSGFICSCTEEYNGSSWSSGGALSTARRQLAGAGAFNAGIAFGGANPSNVSCTEEFSP